MRNVLSGYEATLADLPAVASVKLVEKGVAGWSVQEFPIENIIPAFRVRGFNQTGVCTSPHVRVELQGQPEFSGLLGPMWDGDAIRYENQAAYTTLSN